MHKVTTTTFGTRLNGEHGPTGITTTHHATRTDAFEYAVWNSDRGTPTYPIQCVITDHPDEQPGPFARDAYPAPAGYDLTHALCVAAYEWHGGQGSRLYRLACRLNKRLRDAGMPDPMDARPPDHLMIWADRTVAPESPFA